METLMSKLNKEIDRLDLEPTSSQNLGELNAYRAIRQRVDRNEPIGDWIDQELIASQQHESRNPYVKGSLKGFEKILNFLNELPYPERMEILYGSGDISGKIETGYIDTSKIKNGLLKQQLEAELARLKSKRKHIPNHFPSRSKLAGKLEAFEFAVEMFDYNVYPDIVWEIARLGKLKQGYPGKKLSNYGQAKLEAYRKIKKMIEYNRDEEENEEPKLFSLRSVVNPGPQQLCPTCKGRMKVYEKDFVAAGLIFPNVGTTCPTCKGQGLIPYTPEEECKNVSAPERLNEMLADAERWLSEAEDAPEKMLYEGMIHAYIRALELFEPEDDEVYIVSDGKLTTVNLRTEDIVIDGSTIKSETWKQMERTLSDHRRFGRSAFHSVDGKPILITLQFLKELRGWIKQLKNE